MANKSPEVFLLFQLFIWLRTRNPPESSIFLINLLSRCFKFFVLKKKYFPGRYFPIEPKTCSTGFFFFYFFIFIFFTTQKARDLPILLVFNMIHLIEKTPKNCSHYLFILPDFSAMVALNERSGRGGERLQEQACTKNIV